MISNTCSAATPESCKKQRELIKPLALYEFAKFGAEVAKGRPNSPLWCCPTGREQQHAKPSKSAFRGFRATPSHSEPLTNICSKSTCYAKFGIRRGPGKGPDESEPIRAIPTHSEPPTNWPPTTTELWKCMGSCFWVTDIHYSIEVVQFLELLHKCCCFVQIRAECTAMHINRDTASMARQNDGWTHL